MAPLPFVAAAGALGSGVAGGVATNIVTTGYKRLVEVVTVRGWERADALGRLSYLLEASYSEEVPEMTHERLMEWQHNPAFMDVYRELAAGADAAEARPALIAALEPLMTATETRTVQQAAEYVSDGLPALLVEAQDPEERILLYLHEARNAMQVGFERLSSQIQEGFAGAATPIFIIGSDWPQDDVVERARETDPGGLGNLNQDLEGKDRGEHLPRLVRNPRGWTSNLGAAVWELIALLCEQEGLWEEAKLAWMQARQRPGADYATYSVRAAEAAVGASQREGAVELLNEAREDSPDHPRIAFHEAIAIADQTECLGAFDAITGADDELTSMVFVAKAACYLKLNSTPQAREMLAGARDAGGASTLGYRITESSLAVLEMQSLDSPDQSRVDELVSEALSLEEELLRRHQFVQAAGLRGHAFAFRAFTGDFEGAADVLRAAVPTYENSEADARLTLAMAAAHLRTDDLIRPLLTPEDADRLRARYLSALLLENGNDEDKAAAAAKFNELLDAEHPQIRTLAAMRRMAIASQVTAVGWSEKAEELVAADQPEPATIFKSFFLENTGHPEQAEVLLLRFSDDAWAMAELMRLALRQEEWEKAAERAGALLERGTDWSTHLQAADALRRNHEDSRAEAEFEKLAANVQAPPAIRVEASRVLVQADFAAQRFSQAQARCQRWLDIEPSSSDAGWALIYALRARGRDEEAFAEMARLGLHPRRSGEYRGACQLILAYAESEDALRRVISLADELDPPDEQLEAFVVVAAMQLGQEVPDDLADRVAISRFMQHFPDSKTFRALSIEEFEEFLHHDLAERTKHINALGKDMLTEGQLPSAVLAAVIGTDLGSLWMRLSGLAGVPAGYSNDQLDELERQDAHSALGRPALWDPTSIFVVAHVVSDFACLIRTSFPASSITQAGLDDIAQGARVQASHSPAHVERQEVTYNEALGQPELINWDADAARGDVERAHAALGFAQRLTAVADSDAADPQPEDEQLEASESPAYKCFVATFSVARRLGLPVYSDDREIRRIARQSGLPSFGTLSVIDALVESGQLTPEQRTALRRKMLSARFLGVHPSPAELQQMAADTDWTLSLELAVAMLDGGPWREGIVPNYYAWATFLWSVFRERPDVLPRWVARFLDAGLIARSDLVVGLQAQCLVTIVLLSTEVDRPQFVAALLDAIERARPLFASTLGDPAYGGLAGLRTLLERGYFRGPPAAAQQLLVRAWRSLPPSTQPRTLELLR